MNRVLGAILSAWMVVGCGQASDAPVPTPTTLPPGRVSLPDHQTCRDIGSTPCVDTGHALFGILRQEYGCIWLQRDNGDEVRIVWPQGYSAIFEPLTIYDAKGKVVAHLGDRLTPDGSGPFEGDADACGRTAYVVINDPVSSQ